MKKMLKPLVLLLIVAVVLGAVGCKLLQEKVIEIVLQHGMCMTFPEYETTANWADPETLDVAGEIDDALAEIELSRDKIVEAKMLAASYEVTEFMDPGHDWIMTGGIRIEYDGSTETIVDITSQSIRGAMGGPTYAVLVPEGVDLLNQAIYDYYELGLNPIVVFSLFSESAQGDGGEPVTELDPLDFTWVGCMKMWIIVEETLEVVDPA